MYSKQHEIEELVDELIENTILEALAGSLSSAKECEVALEILRDKLDEIEVSKLKDLFE